MKNDTDTYRDIYLKKEITHYTRPGFNFSVPKLHTGTKWLMKIPLLKMRISTSIRSPFFYFMGFYALQVPPNYLG